MNTFEELWSAIDDGDVAAVRRMLGEHPDLLEATNENEFTPLMHAASCIDRTVPVIREIIKAGADVNRRTEEGYTALHCAVDVIADANLNTEEVIRLLVASGADLNARQQYGWTPLLKAVFEGTADEVNVLLAVGADPDDTMPLDTMPPFNAGRTALMVALCRPEVTEALLQAGADPFKPGGNGTTYFDCAEELQRETPETSYFDYGGEYPRENEGNEFAEKVRQSVDFVRKRSKRG